jgi:hypothetical protein
MGIFIGKMGFLIGKWVFFIRNVCLNGVFDRKMGILIGKMVFLMGKMGILDGEM